MDWNRMKFQKSFTHRSVSSDILFFCQIGRNAMPKLFDCSVYLQASVEVLSLSRGLGMT